MEVLQTLSSSASATRHGLAQWPVAGGQSQSCEPRTADQAPTRRRDIRRRPPAGAQPRAPTPADPGAADRRSPLGAPAPRTGATPLPASADAPSDRSRRGQFSAAILPMTVLTARRRRRGAPHASARRALTRWPPSALALGRAAEHSQRITPNFKDADITQIIEAVSMATGKNFIIDPRVRAQVTMLSSTPMTPDQFYQAFLAILQVHGFVAVPAGNVIKIVPGRQHAPVPGRRPARPASAPPPMRSSPRCWRSRTSTPRSWCRCCGR